MKETHDFLVPDYFTQFACKMGACRSACCQGWPISITMQNYFILLGVECRRELRDRLDCGMYLVDRPTEDEYARFSMRYDGECPLRMDDGRCSIHAELGTEVLPNVCDLYPRGIRSEPGYECSCAASCEAVLELLIHRTEPLTFRRESLTFRMPRTPKRLTYFETLGRETEIRLCFIRIVQDRTLSLPMRLMKLGEVLHRMDAALQSKDAETVEALLNGTADAELSVDPGDVGIDALLHGLKIVEKMIELLDRYSDSIREYGEEALAYFEDRDRAWENYESAKRRFETRFPDWEVFFEHMLVNHMFFVQFPFQDRPEKLMEEFVALCGVYVLLRFLTVGCMGGKADVGENELIDLCAAMFRMVEHTEFDRYASRMLHSLSCTRPADVWELVSL